MIFKKDIWKVKKHITQMDFGEYCISENQTFQRTPKVYYGRFLWNELHERNCHISKCRWDDLEIKVGLDDQSFCWVCLSMSIRLPRTGFIKGQTSKTAFLLVILGQRFHRKVLKKLWAVKHHCIVYHLSIYHITKKYQSVSIHCLQSIEPFSSKHFTFH